MVLRYVNPATLRRPRNQLVQSRRLRGRRV